MKQRVSLVKYASYRRREVSEAVERSVFLLGGVNCFVGRGETVIVKPNLLRASSPEDAIVTHPEVVRAVVCIIQGAGGEPVIVDSPGGPSSRMLLKMAYEKAGLVRVAEETGAKLSYDTSSKIVSFPEGNLIKAFEVLNVVSEADAVITVPKLKTHSLTYLTGATKIIYGVVPGISKAAYHAKLADVERFSTMLLDLNNLIKPRLSIMDAVVGMDGNGPSAGSPKKIGAILSGSDHLAVDVVASSLVGFNALDVTTIKAAATCGLTSGKLEDVEVLGEKIEDMLVKDFTPPVKAKKPWFMPQVAQKIMKWQLTPYPLATEACVVCGVCVTNCPVKAIEIKGKRAKMNLSKCIRCYCCHETCPYKAIELKTPLMRKLIG
jgi:uncharacterized protein (DUF362 family)/NAD-dependent dihydropyrimidine dehydrogenase PreA subunit